MTKPLATLAALALVAAACPGDRTPPSAPAAAAPGDAAPASPPPAPKEPVAADPKPVEPKPAESPPTPDPAASAAAAKAAPKPAARPVIRVEPAKAKADHASWKALLAEGRKASKARDYALAVTKYAAAHALEPGHAGVLGELGWARFQLGQSKQAFADLHKALTMAVKPGRRGALLYNLGRVLEARGDAESVAAALRMYERSLSARPHAVVKRRLDGLKAKAAASKGFATVTAVCGAIADEAGCDWDRGKPVEDEDAELCGCEEKAVAIPAGGQGLEGAVVLTLGGSIGGSIATTYQYLALKFGGRWFKGSLLVNEFNPGFGYVYGSGQLRSLEVRRLPSGQDLVVAVSVNGHVDLNPGIDEVEEDDATRMHLCFLDGNTPTCVNLVLERSSVVRAMTPEDMGREDDRSEQERAAADAGNTQAKATFEVALLPDGRVHIKSAKGDLTDAERALPGTWTLRELARREGVEVERL